jgi:hypothetical protein
MPTLDITEYDGLAYDQLGKLIMTGMEPSVLNQQVDITASSEQSAALGETTRFVRIHADAACRIAVGENPTASSASMRVGAGGTEYLGVRPGLKIAVIATT